MQTDITMKLLNPFLYITLYVLFMNACTDKKTLENREATKATIIALETQALELWNNGNPDGFLNLSSDNVVYIDPFFEQQLEGIEHLKTYYEGMRGQVKVDHYEIRNPLVQLTSDIAVLTYNLISHSGNDIYKWNCTEVYSLDTDGQWKIIHTHWSLLKPINQGTS